MADVNFKKERKKLLKKLGITTDVDLAGLSKEMATMGSQIFSVGFHKAKAEQLVDKAAAQIEIVKAKCYKAIKKQATKKKKKYTLPELDAKVKAHPKYNEAIQAHIKAKYSHNVLWAALNAVNAKATQVTNLAYNKRKEIDANMHRSIRAESTKNKTNKRNR